MEHRVPPCVQPIIEHRGLKECSERTGSDLMDKQGLARSTALPLQNKRNVSIRADGTFASVQFAARLTKGPGGTGVEGDKEVMRSKAD